jgi:hypothetical protein
LVSSQAAKDLRASALKLRFFDAFKQVCEERPRDVFALNLWHQVPA